MARPRSETPKEHISIIRAKKKDGWTYVQRVVSVYDPKIKNSRRVSTESLGKLPPGETDLKNMVPLTPRRKRVLLKQPRSQLLQKSCPIQETPAESSTRLMSFSASLFLQRWEVRHPALKSLNTGVTADRC